MQEIISIINQKGGVGKSTTAQALGAGLILKGFKVLLIDLDAQGNLSYTAGADITGLTVIDVLEQRTSPEQAIQRTAQGDIIPASPSLAGADMLLTQTGKEYRLKEAIEPLKSMYDYFIIDTPPALGILTINALTACTGVIIPAQADIYSLQGIGQLYHTIKTVKQYCNPDLKIKGILLTRHNNRTVLSRDMAEMIEETAKQLNTIVYKTTIRETVTVKEAQASRTDLYSYSPKSNAAADYTAFIEEVIKGGEK